MRFFINITPVFGLTVASSLAFFSPASAQEGASDSAIYMQKRSEALGKDSAGNWRYVAASDEIAALGLFKRARTLLEELTKSAADTAVIMQLKPVEKRMGKSPSWRLNSGVDYVKFNDPEIERNEAVMIDPHTLDDRRFFFGAEMTCEPRRLKAIPLTSSIEISNQDAVAGVRLQGILADSALSFSGRLEGKKRFWRDIYSADTTLRGDNILRIAGRQSVVGKIDSSDMIRGKAAVKWSNKNHNSRIAFSAPLEYSMEKYVENRSPYISFYESGLSPSVTFTSQDMATSLAFEADARYRNYEPVLSGGIEKDTLNRLSLRPELALNIWRKRISVEARCSYAYDRYPAGKRPEYWGEMTSYGKAAIKMTERIEPDLIIQYRNERMRATLTYIDTVSYEKNGFFEYRDTVWKTASYSLTGNVFEFSPQVSIRAFNNITFGIGVRSEIADYPLFSSNLCQRNVINSQTSIKDSLLIRDYLDESQQLVAPEITINMEHRRVRILTRAAYEFTEAGRKNVYYFNTKQLLRLGCNMNVDFAKRFSVFIVADFELGRYDNAKRPQTNTSLFGGLAVRLP